ncbi:MAG: hypothetical protein OEZ31_11940 [Nitrospirota bacterium]|nr:hypothetical protein [Nitrospirota bacterium]MDH5769647.1 hypothetical protein [Nitrospirota bacterium]
MTVEKLLCVDCIQDLKKISIPQLNIFYCDNNKCRRYGVLTVGGLVRDTCEKQLVLEMGKD